MVGQGGVDGEGSGVGRRLLRGAGRWGRVAQGAEEELDLLGLAGGLLGVLLQLLPGEKVRGGVASVRPGFASAAVRVDTMFSLGGLRRNSSRGNPIPDRTLIPIAGRTLLFCSGNEMLLSLLLFLSSAKKLEDGKREVGTKPGAVARRAANFLKVNSA